jgi:DNA-binding response OmpR family regulator
VTQSERRFTASPDRRRVARGGRRDSDRAGRFPTILVADQYEDARSPIARYLLRYGFEVLEAANAAEASTMAEAHRPQVILSGLSGSDATAFYESLAAPDAESRIVIVLLSGMDQPVPPQATGAIAKPFSLRPMLETVRQGLRSLAAFM